MTITPELVVAAGIFSFLLCAGVALLAFAFSKVIDACEGDNKEQGIE